MENTAQDGVEVVQIGLQGAPREDRWSRQSLMGKIDRFKAGRRHGTLFARLGSPTMHCNVTSHTRFFPYGASACRVRTSESWKICTKKANFVCYMTVFGC